LDEDKAAVGVVVEVLELEGRIDVPDGPDDDCVGLGEVVGYESEANT
jgi:hypothetical protein